MTPPIPSGWQYYPLSLFADVAAALAAGIPAPTDNPQGVWLPPDQFREIRKMVDPAVADHIAKQGGNCAGCGG